MKTTLSVVLLCGAAALPGSAQSLQADTTATAVPVSSATALAAIPATADGYSVTEVGANHRRWTRVNTVPDARGKLCYTTNSYIELQECMYYVRQGPSGPEWAESKAEIEGFPGGAIARKGQVQMIFANDLAASGAIDAQTPAGRLRFQVIGLCYADSALQSNQWIAVSTSCQGQIISPNQVLYPAALVGDGFSAGVRYTYRQSGFEQDILITDPAAMMAPEAYGLDSSSPTLTLQVITEFIDPPVPAQTRSAVTTTGGAAFQDEDIDWGSMKLQRGKAFFLGQDPEAKGIPVNKRWVEVNSRRLLVEEVPFSSFMKALLSKDPGASLKPGAKPNRRLASLKGLRVLPPASGDSKPMQVAAAPVPEASFLIDFYVTLTTTVSNVVFASDNTYFIPGTSGAVNLNGTTTIERGSVIKFASTNSAKLLLNGPLVCQTGPYGIAALTSMHDSSVGTAISGASGNPTNTGAIYIDAAASQTNAYSYLRVAYAGTGLRGPNFTNGVWHSQFVQCGTAVASTTSNPVRLRNVLLARCTNGVVTTGGFTGEHLTVDQCSTLLSGAGSSGNLTNSLLTAVTTLGSVNRYATPNLASSSGVYQTVGAASYLLADGSTNRNAGLSNIHPALASALSRQTTYPPIVLSNIVLSADTTLAPQAQRDTDVLDCGYHYTPIDYLCSCCSSNATLTLTNGVVIGYMTYVGLLLHNGGRLVSCGSPVQRNYLVHYNLVQEQAINLASPNSISTAMAINPWHTDSSRKPSIVLRFTTLMAQAGVGWIMFTGDTGWETSGFDLRDCEVFGAGGTWHHYDPAGSVITLRNNLFRYANVDVSPAGQLTTGNNLFSGTTNYTVFFWNVGTNTFTHTNNAFEGALVYLDGAVGYNAYLNGASLVSGSLQLSDIVTNLTWVTGPLGSYYQPTNSPLIDKGSTWATNLGLYHFTTTTNQVKEAGTKVDIGFHLVALGTNGLPVSTSGDGLGDYLKDSNGNGVCDSADMGNWKTNDTCGDGLNDYIKYLQGRNLRVRATNDPNNLIQLNVYTPLK